MSLEIFRPKYLFYQVEDISTQWLQAEGVKYILLDVDNTIAVWNEEQVSTSVECWIKNTLQQGIKIILISNSGSRRLKRISSRYGVSYISWACKPFNGSFIKALQMLQCADKKQALVIGDQVFTDVFGGNRLEIRTVLLTPRFDRDYIWTTLIRQLEKIVLKKLHISKKTRL